MKLKRSSDQKVANHVTPAGNVSIKNAFGLPAGKSKGSCPGMTGICDTVCYADKIERRRSNVAALVQHNFDLLRQASYRTMINLLDDMISDFERECDRKSALKAFRIHWDGDFYSREYAAAWRQVIMRHPNTQFWAYTRSFVPKVNVVDLLVNIPNLSFYLSVDYDNLEYAHHIVAEYPEIGVSALAPTMAESALIVKQLRGNDRPGAKCPELIGALPLISPQGSACIRCNLCPMGKADIRFASLPSGRN